MVQACRKKCIFYTEQREKAEGMAVRVGTHPREAAVTRLKLNRDHKERKAKSPPTGRRGAGGEAQLSVKTA